MTGKGATTKMTGKERLPRHFVPRNDRRRLMNQATTISRASSATTELWWRGWRFREWQRAI